MPLVVREELRTGLLSEDAEAEQPRVHWWDGCIEPIREIAKITVVVHIAHRRAFLLVSRPSGEVAVRTVVARASAAAHLVLRANSLEP